MRKSLFLIGPLVLSVLFLAARVAHSDVETKTFVAYSMKVAQAKVEAAVKAGEDFRKKQPDLYYLGGITKPWALVVDSKNDDWIILGERDTKSSVLTLDDWIVALRARFVHPDKDPGVTIDPRACDECLKAGKKEGCSHYKRQDVRFFGGIENTHFGQVCYEADWLMKRIGLGLDKLQTDKIKSYFDLSVEQAKNAGGTNTSVVSRFWFYPVVSRVNVLGDVVLLEKFQMGVFTEVLYAEMDGKPVENPDKVEHYPSGGFSRSLSENYDAAAASREVLESLRGMSRLAALAKGLTQVTGRPNVSFCVESYRGEGVETPRDVEVLKAESKDTGFSVRGGVSLTALAMQFKDGDAGALKKLVTGTRPASESLSWAFEMDMKNGQPVCVNMPKTASDPTGLAALFNQAMFLYEMKRYDAAVGAFDQVIKIQPLLAGGWNNKGIALSHVQRYDDAIKCYDSALGINSGLAEAWSNKGNALFHLQRYDDAIKCYDRALGINSGLAEAWSNKGGALSHVQRYDDAIACFDRSLEIGANVAGFWYNKGSALADLKRFGDALKCFDEALEIEPQYAKVWLNKGIILADMKRFGDALECFDRALEIEPQNTKAWLSKGNTLADLKLYDDGVKCFDRVLRIQPQDVAAWCNRGAALAKLGLYGESLKCFDRALEIEPGLDVARANRTITMEMMESHSGEVKKCILEGQTYYSVKRYSDALRCYDQALEIDARSVEAHLNKSIVLCDLKRYREALRCCERALDVAPDFASAWFVKSMVLELLNRTSEARTALRKARQLE